MGDDLEGGTAENRRASRSFPPQEGDAATDSTAEQLDLKSEVGTAENSGASGYSPPPSPEGVKTKEEPLTVELLKQKEAEEEDAGTYTVPDEYVQDRILRGFVYFYHPHPKDGEGNSFTLCVSPHLEGWYPILPMRGWVPHPRSGRGVPHPALVMGAGGGLPQ